MADLLAGIDGATETGVVTRWICRAGDHVRRDEVLAEVETDKANTELRAPEDGVVVALLVPTGESFARNAPILRFESLPLGEARSSLEGRVPDASPIVVAPVAPSAPNAGARSGEARCRFCHALQVGRRIDCKRCGAPR